MPLIEPTKAHVRSLLLLFAARTAVLLALAASATFFFSSTLSPYGYDTSSTHLFLDNPSLFEGLPGRLAVALTRWDAIYFVSIGERGYIWEQEWAFQRGLGDVVNTVEGVLSQHWTTTARVLASSSVSVIAHCLSALVLYYLTLSIFSLKTKMKSDRSATHLAFIAASLHILSPAGIFLIAPYTESLFSLLSFTGYWLYTLSVHSHTSWKSQTWMSDVYMLLAGACFGISCSVRGNGVLNGTLLLWEAIVRGLSVLQGQEVLHNTRKLLVAGLSGLIMGVGVLWPQYLAWLEFCVGENTRGWCSSKPPSIYAFVQAHYWNTGFLHYWTLSNLPLFALAAPVLYTLIHTASKIFLALSFPQTCYVGLPISMRTVSPSGLVILRRLALPQLILAILALTTYHVQIITRLSSGYPVWYIYVASKVVEEFEREGTNLKEARGGNMGGATKYTFRTEGEAKATPSRSKWATAVVRWSIGYATVQAVLFGSFLPPA